MSIICRKSEITEFDALIQSKKAEFLIVYGRRRIGKTYLIHNYFRDKGIYFELMGQKDASLATQLDNFAIEFSDIFYKGKKQNIPSSWNEAFQALRRQIEKLPKTKKIILFFDELPWLASPRSGFLEALDHFWNRYLSKLNNIILIGCGSAASWMIDNILNNKGGLHNRATRQMRLLPFSLGATEQFLKSQNVILEKKQIIELYMALGGVAGYLIHIKPGLSAAQNINDICFSRDGALITEFYKLYRSLFDNHERHVGIIKLLAKKHSGYSKEEIANKLGLGSGGSLSQTIKELEEAGFILQIPEFGGVKKGARYRLIDEFSLFFLSWMEKAPNSAINDIDADYWLKKRTSTAWPIWSGYVFENICLKHVQKIKESLGIAAVTTNESGWIYKGNSKTKGAQIDLVIDRADGVINLCEIKYLGTSCKITKSYADSINNKRELFREATNTKKTLFATLITTYGAIENSHYLNAINQQLVMDVLF